MNYKLLLIHPDQKLQSLYSRHLGSYFAVDSAYDGMQGLKLIKSAKPNLILSDYHLPRVSGATLLSFVRNDAELHKIPFVFISHQQPALESLGLGATDWLVLSSHNPASLIEKCFNYLNLAKLPSSYPAMSRLGGELYV